MTPNETEIEQSMPSLSPQQISATARWIHAHKSSTSDNFFGYTLYQFLRSAVASVPYGVSMAGTWLGFQKAEDFFGNMKNAQKLGSAGNYGKQLFGSPLIRTGAMIATSFTLYRATSKIAKWVNEYLFNPQDSLEVTQEKLERLPEMLTAKAKEVYLPEGHSTFISAFVLSALVVPAMRFGKNEHVTKALEETKQMLGGTHSFNPKAWGHFWKEGILNPKSQFVEQAAVNGLGYSLFFELGDRRFKDKQISRGLWGGKASSLGSSSRSNPSLLQPDMEDNGIAQPTIKSPVIGELPQGSRMNDNLSILTSEPSFVRFVGRRLVPTMVGIAAYTAIKFRGGKLFFGNFPDPKDIGTFKGFLRNSYAEGAATSLFFVVPWVSDKYAPVFDKAVDTLEAKVSGRPYEQVIAGYQPKAANENVMMAANSNQPPETKVQKPAEHALVSALPRHANSV